jgi:hypothetical protein
MTAATSDWSYETWQTSSWTRRRWKIVGRWIGSLGSRSRSRSFEAIVTKAAKADLDPYWGSSGLSNDAYHPQSAHKAIGAAARLGYGREAVKAYLRPSPGWHERLSMYVARNITGLAFG